MELVNKETLLAYADFAKGDYAPVNDGQIYFDILSGWYGILTQNCNSLNFIGGDCSPQNPVSIRNTKEFLYQPDFLDLMKSYGHLLSDDEKLKVLACRKPLTELIKMILEKNTVKPVKWNLFQGEPPIIIQVAKTLGFKTSEPYYGFFTKEIFPQAFFYLYQRFGMPEPFDGGAGAWSFQVKKYDIEILFNSDLSSLIDLHGLIGASNTIVHL